jgi:hypothetical protein
MNRLTDSEKLMYDVMGAIADSNVPVIFKGALVSPAPEAKKYILDMLLDTVLHLSKLNVFRGFGASRLGVREAGLKGMLRG